MGFLSKLFKSDHIPLSDASWASLGTDLHSHLIPGIDDGAEDLDQSMAMIEGMQRLGFRKLITTPHVMMDSYKNNAQSILTGLEKVQQAIREKAWDIQVEASAEYMVDDGFETLVKSGNLLCFHGKHLLIELSTFMPHPNLKSILFQLQLDGYTVVLGHAERYSYWYKAFHEFEDLKNREVLFQVNTLSFGGFYNPDYKKTAEKMAGLGMIDFLGSDMHRPAQEGALARCRQLPVVQRLMDSGKLLNSQL